MTTTGNSDNASDANGPAAPASVPQNAALTEGTAGNRPLQEPAPEATVPPVAAATTKPEHSAANEPAAPPRNWAETAVGLLLDPKKLLSVSIKAFAELYDRHPRAFGLTAVGLLVVTIGLRVAGVD